MFVTLRSGLVTLAPALLATSVAGRTSCNSYDPRFFTASLQWPLTKLQSMTA